MIRVKPSPFELPMPDDPFTPEDRREAAIKARDRDSADRLARDIEHACEYHPERVREALGKVFDLSAIDECGKRQMIVLTRIWEQQAEASAKASAKVSALYDEARKVEGLLADMAWQSAELNKTLTKLASRMGKANKYVRALEESIGKRIAAIRSTTAAVEAQLKRYGFLDRPKANGVK
jgi:hypothetical protein